MWIDTDQLRKVSEDIAGLRDSVLPPAAFQDPGSCGYPDLIRACAAFDDELTRVALMTAREVDALAIGARTAADQWDRMEEAAVPAR